MQPQCGQRPEQGAELLGAKLLYMEGQRRQEDMSGGITQSHRTAAGNEGRAGGLKRASM